MSDDTTPTTIDFEDIVAGPRHVEMDWLDHQLQFDYSPGGYSNDLQAQFNQHSKRDDSDPKKVRLNDTMLLAMLRSWNLHDAVLHDMKPITKDTIERLPVPMKSRMIAAMIKDMGMGEAGESRTSSPVPSRETAGVSRNGTESSAQLEVMA